MGYELFHPLIARWFAGRFGVPTAPQSAGWPQIAAGRDTLIAAPTGSGKTLAAFLWAINRLIEPRTAGPAGDRTSVVYVSPLKALGNDIQKNLQQPLAEIQQLAAHDAVRLPDIRVLVRSGDTPAHERQSMLRKPPQILITTPESLYILLTAERSRRMLAYAETVIVDEIHAVAGTKRGAHLALSLERLDALAARRLQRIGLSATQNPIIEIARLLVGSERCLPDGAPDCAIVDIGHRRALDLRIEVGEYPLGPIATHELYADIYDRIATHTCAHRTTIVFVNTRRLVERAAHQLEQRLGAGKVAAHHGSLSRRTRLQAEEGLKSGAIPVVVATASLELGIDVGHVDLVCHLGAPRALATLLQRVGRAGHCLGTTPKGRLFPLTRDDLVQCAAAVRAIRAGQLDRVRIPEQPLDILAQQIVATVASETADKREAEPSRRSQNKGPPQAERKLSFENNNSTARPEEPPFSGGVSKGARRGRSTVPSGEIGEADLSQLVRRAYPFRNLEPHDFEALLEMLSEGVATRRGRRSAHVHRDRVHGRLRARRGARLAAITGGGAIPDTADYDVVEDPTAMFVGKVNEDFAVESAAGDIFLLGNRSWRIRRIEAGRVRVEDAQGAPTTIPFWVGEAPARTAELSAAVADLREEVAARLADAPAAAAWLMTECNVDQAGAEQIVAYIADTRAVLGAVPSQRVIVAERFFDEAGGMQLVIHAPFGAAINRAWGLALRKRFCRTFDFELQAAATDDGIVISLGEQHSFALDGVFAMVRTATLESDLVQAVLAAPMFTTRWRWNATRALALLRHSGGKRVPMAIQRMRAEDLLAAVFPAQLACGENHPGGPTEVPEHPLVKETIDNCLHEAMDLEGLRAVIESIERGEHRTVAIDTAAPSPMSHEILNANPYAFLDDAPLEERRARAVSLRRVDSDLASGLGALDPAAVDEVRRQAWPDMRDADELHDLLLSVVVLPLQVLTPAALRKQSCDLPFVIPEKETGDFRHGNRSLPLKKGGQEGFVDEPFGKIPLDPPFSKGEDDAILPAAYLSTVRKAEIQTQLISDGRATIAHWDEHDAIVAAERVLVARAALSGVKFDPPLAPLPDSVQPGPEDAVHRVVQGWLECLGPVTTAALASFLGIPEHAVETALLRLESEGVVLRGRFTALDSRQSMIDSGGANPELSTINSRLPLEWCDRRLLARIHRLTIGRLRQEIEAVPPADFIRFLLRWQHVHPGTQLHGRDGVLQVIAQLQGLELPAPAWERDILPARVALYNPADLEQLCLAGEVAWGRLRPAVTSSDDGGDVAAAPHHRRAAPTRAAPLAFVRRDALPALLQPAGDSDVLTDASSAARDVFAHLERHGASFLSDIARATGRLPTETEDALWELVARGLVTGDGIAGLRTLLLPDVKRRQPRQRLRSVRGGPARRSMPIGRWSVLRTASNAAIGDEAAAEFFARQLLRRYGVVLRELVAREACAPLWRVLLRLYRRMEARGEIRGGRFVAGLVGEQFALPEAVDALRAVRRKPGEHETATIAAADPLNLVGLLTSGARVSPFSTQVIAYENGVPVEVGELGAVLSRLQRGELKVETIENP